MRLSWQKRLRNEAARLYGRLNRKYFAGDLPTLPIVLRRKMVDGDTWGAVTFDDETPTCVELSMECWKQSENASFLRAVLIHEMMHVKLGHTSTEHPKDEWNAEAIRLSKLGALVETL